MVLLLFLNHSIHPVNDQFPFIRTERERKKKEGDDDDDEHVAKFETAAVRIDRHSDTSTLARALVQRQELSRKLF